MPRTEIKRLRDRAVSTKTGLPRSSRYELIAKGQFPRPVHLGERAVAWVEAEIDEWCEARIAERDSRAA